MARLTPAARAWLGLLALIGIINHLIQAQGAMQLKAVEVRPGPRCTALREGLPFGAVMATAGASVMARYCGLQDLVSPLLALAVLQVLWSLLAGAWRHRTEFSLGWRAWWAIGPAHEHAGVHTVPLGLAVIASGLVALTANGTAPWALTLAGVYLGLTWLLTIVCGGRCTWSLMSRGLTLRTFDGAWFLVPAALLGAAIATDAMAGRVVGRAAAFLAVLALAGALFGWLGYWAVALAAVVRVRRYGLTGVPQAPWWIAMGCAGLAAAALGRALTGTHLGLPLRAFLTDAMVVTTIAAVILCIPILVLSTLFLLRRCRFRGPASWPPTFSTAVFALGCLEMGDVLHSPVFEVLGLGAGYATLVFWAVTAIWNVAHSGIARLRDRAMQGSSPPT